MNDHVNDCFADDVATTQMYIDVLHVFYMQ